MPDPTPPRKPVRATPVAPPPEDDDTPARPSKGKPAKGLPVAWIVGGAVAVGAVLVLAVAGAAILFLGKPQPAAAPIPELQPFGPEVGEAGSFDVIVAQAKSLVPVAVETEPARTEELIANEAEIKKKALMLKLAEKYRPMPGITFVQSEELTAAGLRPLETALSLKRSFTVPEVLEACRVGFGVRYRATGGRLDRSDESSTIFVAQAYAGVLPPESARRVATAAIAYWSAAKPPAFEPATPGEERLYRRLTERDPR